MMFEHHEDAGKGHTNSRVSSLIRPVIVNLGLEMFAEALDEQNAEVIHVAWNPPAVKDEAAQAILDSLL